MVSYKVCKRSMFEPQMRRSFLSIPQIPITSMIKTSTTEADKIGDLIKTLQGGESDVMFLSQLRSLTSIPNRSEKSKSPWRWNSTPRKTTRAGVVLTRTVNFGVPLAVVNSRQWRNVFCHAKAAQRANLQAPSSKDKSECAASLCSDPRMDG